MPPAPSPRSRLDDSPNSSGALFTDLYELTMAQAYHHEGMDRTAVFELFFRELPGRRNFVVAAGLGPLLQLLQSLRFTDRDLDYLRSEKRFSERFLDQLENFRFTGDVRAVPEGTVVFENEPLVQVIAPLPQAQLIETLVLNQLHFPSIAASKAARLTLAAGGRRVIDFGSRRAHGRDAALSVARAAYIAGADGTSLVQAGAEYGIPIFGTMAHSYIQSHEDESSAFGAFLESFPASTLLVDTYDTLRSVQKVIDLSRRLGDSFRAAAIRLDSGDLLELSRRSRDMLDQAGLGDVQIVASGGLDEDQLQRLAAAGAPIDGYGLGTSLAVSDDAPALDMAYKLVEYDGRSLTKLSTEKEIYPGRKQILRYRRDGQFTHDLLTHSDHAAASTGEGQPLLEDVMREGRLLEAGQVPLEQSRHRAREQLQSLPESLRQLDRAEPPYRVEIGSDLREALERLRAESA